MSKKLIISLFCGGRGGAALIREIKRISNVELNLLVNAYDDGLSTGALRKLIPGMLGPSDFRKNLTYLIDPHSPIQFALVEILEHRLSAVSNDKIIHSLKLWIGLC
jgi:2-phospho-L-lactate transferase/gluconeogenesis factor (CofD/UPF0052 family)